MTINNIWAYNKNDHEFKSSRQLIGTLVEVASRGGNFLLNVGPQPDGVIQPEFQERLRAIGKWMDRNSESIHGTTYGPVHVFDWPGTSLKVAADKLPKVASASMIDSGMPLKFKQEDGRVMIEVRAQAPDADDTVIILRS